MKKDIYDVLADEAVGWFDGWIRPDGAKAEPWELESVKSDIARVFRNGLKEARAGRKA